MEYGDYTTLIHEGEELQVISVGEEPWFVVSDIDRILGPGDVDQFIDYAEAKKGEYKIKRAKIVGENKSDKVEYVINLEGALTLFEFGADRLFRMRREISAEYCETLRKMETKDSELESFYQKFPEVAKMVQLSNAEAAKSAAPSVH